MIFYFIFLLSFFLFFIRWLKAEHDILIRSGNVISNTRSVLTSFKLNLSDISRHYWYFIKHIFCLHGMKIFLFLIAPSLLLKHSRYYVPKANRSSPSVSEPHNVDLLLSIPPTYFVEKLLNFISRSWRRKKKRWIDNGGKYKKNKIKRETETKWLIVHETVALKLWLIYQT